MWPWVRGLIEFSLPPDPCPSRAVDLSEGRKFPDYHTPTSSEKTPGNPEMLFRDWGRRLRSRLGLS